MSDTPDYATMVELVERLQRDSDELRALAEDGDVPAVERNAERVAAAARMARKNLPPELVEE
ncbi:MAG: hypothetical protein ACOCR0_02160 [Haloferacaceae archaeon]